MLATIRGRDVIYIVEKRIEVAERAKGNGNLGFYLFNFLTSFENSLSLRGRKARQWWVGQDVVHEMTPTYGNKRESGPPLFQFLAPHFLCKIDSAFIDSVFFF